MVEIISKNNEKHQNKALRGTENTKQDKYQEKKYDPDFEENFWLPRKGSCKQNQKHLNGHLCRPGQVSHVSRCGIPGSLRTVVPRKQDWCWESWGSENSASHKTVCITHTELGFKIESQRNNWNEASGFCRIEFVNGRFIPSTCALIFFNKHSVQIIFLQMSSRLNTQQGETVPCWQRPRISHSVLFLAQN